MTQVVIRSQDGPTASTETLLRAEVAQRAVVNEKGAEVVVINAGGNVPYKDATGGMQVG